MIERQRRALAVLTRSAGFCDRLFEKYGTLRGVRGVTFSFLRNYSRNTGLYMWNCAQDQDRGDPCVRRVRRA
eukprot:SAG31_NODE_2784_length_5092_cov_10.113158_2_plen_72_part_00